MSELIVERLSRLRITSQSEVTPHRFLYQWDGKPCFARGELVALTGKAKSGKTYMASILMALAETSPVMGIRRFDDSQDQMSTIHCQLSTYKVLWIDTEQSEDSTKEILCTRLAALMGHVPDDERFAVYNLRQEDWQNRLEIVEATIALHKPDLVVFDGIRDVVGDINDYQQAQNVLTKLLSIASWSDACIVCVLHQNKAIEDKTLRGALGTELQNKSFETYECTKDPDTHVITVRQTATRKYDITAKLTFTVDANGLPVQSMGITSVTSKSFAPIYDISPLNPAYLTPDGKIDHAKLFGYILQNGKRMMWLQLKAVVMKVANIRSFSFADTVIKEAYANGVIRYVEDHLQNKFYEYVSPQTEIF